MRELEKGTVEDLEAIGIKRAHARVIVGAMEELKQGRVMELFSWGYNSSMTLGQT